MPITLRHQLQKLDKEKVLADERLVDRQVYTYLNDHLFIIILIFFSFSITLSSNSNVQQ